MQQDFDFQNSFIFPQVFPIYQQDQAEVTMHQALLLIPWRCVVTTYEALNLSDVFHIYAFMEKKYGIIVWPTVKLNKFCQPIHDVLDQAPQYTANIPFYQAESA